MLLGVMQSSVTPRAAVVEAFCGHDFYRPTQRAEHQEETHPIAVSHRLESVTMSASCARTAIVMDAGWCSARRPTATTSTAMAPLSLIHI